MADYSGIFDFENKDLFIGGVELLVDHRSLR